MVASDTSYQNAAKYFTITPNNNLTFFNFPFSLEKKVCRILQDNPSICVIYFLYLIIFPAHLDWGLWSNFHVNNKYFSFCCTSWSVMFVIIHVPLKRKSLKKNNTKICNTKFYKKKNQKSLWIHSCNMYAFLFLSGVNVIQNNV